MSWTAGARTSVVREKGWTEAMDASRQVLRRGDLVLPRRGALVEEFAEHVASDVKQLVEDEDTGAKSYRFVRTGTNHFSLALTYDCIAWSRERYGSPGSVSSGHVALSDIFTKPW